MSAMSSLRLRPQGSESAKARDQLLALVERCSRDRFAFFPTQAREPLLKQGRRDIVLMGGQKASLGLHLQFLEWVIQANPGLRLRALVDESPQTIPQTAALVARGVEVLDPTAFFQRAGEFADAIIVDRYCTWVPGVKYRTKLKQAGLPYLRLEQFLNAPGLAAPYGHFRTHSDFMLAEFDRFLALENLWADERSLTVYYTALAAMISIDFTWLAFGCDQHEDRYLPNDIGLQLGDREVFVDCGAHDGAESILFARRVQNRYRSIRAFEPDRANFMVTSRNLQQYMGEHGVSDMFCYPMGVYDRNAYLGFTGSDVTVMVSDAPADKGPGLFVARLDDFIDEMTYFKLEIEGAELAALRGADGLIRKNKPLLAVSAYHKPDDFLDLSAHILALDMGYTFKLRHHSLEPGVLCIYAQ